MRSWTSSMFGSDTFYDLGGTLSSGVFRKPTRIAHDQKPNEARYQFISPEQAVNPKSRSTFFDMGSMRSQVIATPENVVPNEARYQFISSDQPSEHERPTSRVWKNGHLYSAMWGQARTPPAVRPSPSPVVPNLSAPHPQAERSSVLTPKNVAAPKSAPKSAPEDPDQKTHVSLLRTPQPPPPKAKFLRLNELLDKKNETSFPVETRAKAKDGIEAEDALYYDTPRDALRFDDTAISSRSERSYPFQLIIQTTETIVDVAISLQEYFSTLHIPSRVLTSAQTSQAIYNDTPSSNSLYIFLYVGEMETLPTVSPFCVFNLEQQSYWPNTFPYCHHNEVRTKRMEIAMQRCGIILDYSSHNVDHYPSNLRDKVLHLPLPIGPRRQSVSDSTNNSVVFFGTPSKRRRGIITKLMEEYGIKVDVINGSQLVAGEDLYRRLGKANVVLNLHYKEKSVLETARINACLRACNAHIISEECIDKSTQNIYGNAVEFVPIVSSDYSNISSLSKRILLALMNPPINSAARDAVCAHIDQRLSEKDYGTKVLKEPFLFHKFFLGISQPLTPISYEVTRRIDSSPGRRKSIAHLHCFDISRFHEMYDEYLPTIHELFDIIVTYSQGDLAQAHIPATCLKIENRGLDIGAKFVAVRYLLDTDTPFGRILFLHSKSDNQRRRHYINTLISNSGKLTTTNAFSEIELEMQGKQVRYLNGEYGGKWLPERNTLYRDALSRYLFGKPTGDATFPEGNMYILDRNVVMATFTDRMVYNCLNRPHDFDYNWISHRYGLDKNIAETYHVYKQRSLASRDHASFDGYIEHAFERVIRTAVTARPVSPCKELHRAYCLEGLRTLKNIALHEFGLDPLKETILIEYRELPHIEYLIKRTIMFLSSDWNHTVVCGRENVYMVREIVNRLCDKLQSKIRIIETPSCTSINDYNEMLLNPKFWNQFKGEKLLVYQEDTCLFHGDIEAFLKYDYIGAPWPKGQEENNLLVGNGGFSLRSKSKLLECLAQVAPQSLELPESVDAIRRGVGLTSPAEDVYFTRVMIEEELGTVAPWDVARSFSQESQKSASPLGGHMFWLADAEDMQASLPARLILNSDYWVHANHRCGWKPTIQHAVDTQSVVPFTPNLEIYPKDVALVEGMERTWAPWNRGTCEGVLWSLTRPWVGILHYMADVPPHMRLQAAGAVMLNAKESLSYCQGIVVLSEACKRELQPLLRQLGLEVPIHAIKHPIGEMPRKFDMNNFKAARDRRRVIQLGLQYRKVSTIYKLKTTIPKIWLPGNLKAAHGFATDEWAMESSTPLPEADVAVERTATNEEYDDLLLHHIIIIPLWTASANNSVLECIAMNIPAFITRLPATEEYLGKDYPLFYEDVSEIEAVIDNEELLYSRLEEATMYLSQLDKTPFTYETFCSDLLKVVN